MEKTIQGVTEEREKTEEYMQNIAAVILAPGFVNSEKDPDMDLNTLDMILKRYTRIQSGLRSSMREPEEIKQRALWRERQRNY